MLPAFALSGQPHLFRSLQIPYTIAQIAAASTRYNLPRRLVSTTSRRRESSRSTAEDGHAQQSQPAIEGTTDDAVASTAQGSAATVPVRRVNTFAPKDQRLLQAERIKRARKQLHARTKSSIRRFRGRWSYDWIVPLNLLLRQPLADGEQQDLLDHANSEIDAIDEEHKASLGDVKLYDNRNVHKVPRPEHWSHLTFLLHVRGLAGSRVSSSLHRFLYSKEDPKEFTDSQAHVFQVKKALDYLFSEEKLHAYWSTAACEEAIAFFTRHNMLSGARGLLRAMVDLGVPIQSSTINLILSTFAFHDDLYGFTWLLHWMIQKEVPVNSDTWIAFLRVVQSNSVKKRLYLEMQHQGLLEDVRVLQSTVAELTSMEFRAFSRTATDVRAFLEVMDDKYSPRWFSEHAGNIMVDELLGLEQFDAILEVFDVMVERGCPPTRKTMMIMLGDAMRAKDRQWADQILERFARTYKVDVKEQHIEPLFLLGWRTHSYNTCRLVWHHACINGWVTYPMKKLVLESLLGYVPTNPRLSENIEPPQDMEESETAERPETEDDTTGTTASVHAELHEEVSEADKMWTKQAAKVICGVGDVPANTRLAELVQWTNKGAARTVQIATAKSILEHDITSNVRRAPFDSFQDLFGLAKRMDELWEGRKAEGKELTLEDKMHSALFLHCQFRKEVSVELYHLLLMQDEPRGGKISEQTDEMSEQVKVSQ